MLYRPSAGAAFLLMVCVAAAEAQTAILQIQVLEGEGAVQAAGARSVRPLTVQITDETGKPVNGAAVSFRLPDGGATGTFGNGLKTMVVLTGVDGRAGDWSAVWGKQTGNVRVRVTAAKDQARAGAMVNLYVSDTVTPAVSIPSASKAVVPRAEEPRVAAKAAVIAPPAAVAAASLTAAGSGIKIFETPRSARPGISRAWWVVMAVGAGGAVAYFYSQQRSSSPAAVSNGGGAAAGSSTAPATGGIRFGQPVVTIGRP